MKTSTIKSYVYKSLDSVNKELKTLDNFLESGLMGNLLQDRPIINVRKKLGTLINSTEVQEFMEAVDNHD